MIYDKFHLNLITKFCQNQSPCSLCHPLDYNLLIRVKIDRFNGNKARRSNHKKECVALISCCDTLKREEIKLIKNKVRTKRMLS